MSYAKQFFGVHFSVVNSGIGVRYLLNRSMDNSFLEASLPKGRGFPGKDLSLFNIAPLNPVLKERVYGEHAGQSV